MRKHWHAPAFLAVQFLFALVSTLEVWASEPARPDAICDQAAIVVANETGVPHNVLLAITRTETARYGAPWPWTVNMGGDGHWFETRSAALQFVERRRAGGVSNFDVGCFQINFRWHGQHFSSVDAMFDPLENARYAADFLTELYSEFGSWDSAVGAYHSRTERHAARYLRIYHGYLETLGAHPDVPHPGPASGSQEFAETNPFPLFQTGGQTTLGSLVPNNSSIAAPLLRAQP